MSGNAAPLPVQTHTADSGAVSTAGAASVAPRPQTAPIPVSAAVKSDKPPGKSNISPEVETSKPVTPRSQNKSTDIKKSPNAPKKTGKSQAPINTDKKGGGIA